MPVKGRPATPVLQRSRFNRWSVATFLALLAVLLVFVDVLLTVEVQRVSLEAHEARKRLDTLSLELGALESQWAARSSHLELDSRAAGLGLSVPEPDQVVLLPAAFLDESSSGRPPGADELRHELLDTWTRLVLVGTP